MDEFSGERLSEEDVKLRYITPALVDVAGWKPEQIKMEQITPGQIIVRGDEAVRGKSGNADYVLRRLRNRKPLAVVEAKKLELSVDAGLQQALDYASKLDAPFAYSTNGRSFVEHDRLTGREREFGMAEFPREDELWQRYLTAKQLDDHEAKLVDEPYYFDPFKNKVPRYYQQVAVDRTIEAIAHGQKRLLLVMATGTGKTFTAFQIIWRLLQAGAVKRVLYLADRNVLIDQTMRDDFSPFSGKITKVQGRHLDSSFEVYMSLYQQLAGDEGEEPFRQFKPEFFDLVVVDECHRGSAREASLWRRVLDYFSGAIHVGMTATPKETKDVSNITYFGEPVYTYSLKQGIEDGFLAPYKVLRVGLDVDLEGWRPYQGQRDVEGHEIDDREYNVQDFDKNLVIDERTTMVAKYVASWLRRYGTDSKTIVFCVDIEHAERMRRALVNEMADEVAKDWRYVMRITGDDQIGKGQLDNFQDVNEQYPTVVTTSKLLTTGVDVRTVKLIVLESNIGSMTEFKQIIGRGTRLAEEHKKKFFTILDFRGSTRLFADPDFDGEPVVVKPIGPPVEGPDGEDVPPEWPPDDEGGLDNPGTSEGGGVPEPPLPPQRQEKIRVRGVDVKLLNERVHYIDPVTGKLIIESLRDFSRATVLGTYKTLDSFIQAWGDADQKTALVQELQDQGVFLDAIREEAGGRFDDVDDFDLIMHIAFDRAPLTKHERIDRVKKRGYLHQFSSAAEQVLASLLDKYADVGISELEDVRVLTNEPFIQFGSPVKIISLFGGKANYLAAVKGLQDVLYESAA